MGDLSVRLSEIVLTANPVAAVDVCNVSLVLIGSDPISSLQDSVSRAITCNRLFPIVRDAVLRAYPWNCAMSYATVSVDETAPPWGYLYRYPLPTSPWCLRMLAMENPAHTFKVVGRYLYTNDVNLEANIRYTGRVTDPSQWDSLLLEAIASRLASNLAIPIGGDKAAAASFWDLYRMKIAEARSADGQEGSVDPIISDDLTSVR